jgi:multidrug efflux system outer membrane protein
MWKPSLVVFLAILVTGCGLFGPSYIHPNTDDPQKFPSLDVLSRTESTNLPALAWWKSFRDEQLNNLIESALRNNNDIQNAIGNIIAAHGSLRQVQFAWIPTGSGAFGYQSRSLAGQGYYFGGTPSYSLNILQQIRSQQYAVANYQAVIAAKNAVRLAVISQVATGYFTLRGQDYQLQLQQQLVKDSKDLLDLAKLEFAEGLISLYQLQTYAQNYQTALAQIPIIENNIIASRNALLVLLNQNPGDVARGRKFMDIDSYGVIPANLPSVVLRNRPDVAQAEQQLIAANANIGVATSMFFPTISLTGTGGTASSGLSGLFAANSDFWVNTAALTMPLLNFGIYGQIEQAKGNYYAAYYNYLQVVRLAFAAVDNDLSAHQQLTVSMDSQIKAYEAAKLAYKLAVDSYTGGLYSKPTLLQNAINLDNAALVVEQSKLQQLGTIVQLYQDLGGGYAYNNYESANKFGDSHDWN